MNIIKASAGSGKTYRLSHTFIDYLLASDDPGAYRHLLAVTFTNKATAEMKARILKDLAEAAKTDPRAKHYLVSILHDYGAFGVSTIDKFFQQTLRSFARELGQFSSYQVELDKESLVREAMDRVLDGVSNDKPELVKWLKTNALAQLRKSGYFRMDDGLVEMGNRLKSDESRQLKDAAGSEEQEAFSKPRLEEIHKCCSGIISDFEKEAAALGFTAEKGKRIGYPTTKKALADPRASELFETKYRDYATAYIVDSQLYGLGVAREFEAEFEALLKEKNVMPLDESNSLLKKIIDGSDAPFVYEKTGTRYAHFLLDEFQDTSRLQWDNFLPLLRDADASGDNLIVGDVKQSIYRWRDSDWRLLGQDVQKEFPGAGVENPDENWRSAREVVDFNSGFFTYAAAAVGLQDMYSNVKQVARADEAQEGCVRVTFTSDQVQAVLDSVADVRSRGAKLSDIAILVRGKKEGAELADALISNGISVISDDSLDLKGAVTVRRLVSLLNYYDNPENTVGSWLARSIGVEFPDNYHSLVDFCECLLRELQEYDPRTFEAESLFIGAFMDRLQEWTETGGNNLRAFVRAWDEADEIYIGSPENSDAVRIMTIHKSKGLEFPHVIFPYADKVGLFKGVTRWCRLDGGGSVLGHVADGIYPVDLSGSTARTLFAPYYEEERKMQLVDNLNIFYVAMTRASKSLHVIAKEPAKGKKPALKEGKAVDWSNFSEMLYAWCGGFEEMTYGTPYDFAAMERKPLESGKPFASVWNSIPLGGRLKASQDASDYFGEDGHTGAEASGRLRGIELHAMLSLADKPEDLPLDMDAESRKLLAERMEAHPEWFAGASRGRNEVSVFDADGTLHRPDRVVDMPDGSIAVIDYKFGAERNSYFRQVAGYVRLYRDMGYPSVRGYVWYVPEDKVVEV